jgi:hypothetical protein
MLHSWITNLCPELGEKERVMKYGVAWLLGVPVSIIALWFVANQMGCGL